MTASPQQPSTVEQIATLYELVRAGKDPDTGELHITQSEFVAAINALIENQNRRSKVMTTKIGDYNADDGENKGGTQLPAGS